MRSSLSLSGRVGNALRAQQHGDVGHRALVTEVAERVAADQHTVKLLGGQRR